MVVDWERLAVASGKLFLLILEYCIKLSAVVVTAVVMAAQGTFGVKLATGFSSISPALRKLFNAPSEISNTARLIHEFNSLPAAVFNEVYGHDAIAGLMAYLGGGVAYIQTVSANFASQPFATFFAATIAFFSLYLTSWVLRFYRQKGEGSWLNKMERKFSDYIFKKPELSPKPEIAKKTEPKRGFDSNKNFKATKKFGENEIAESGNRSEHKKVRQIKSIDSQGMSQSNNKHLENFIRLAQKGGG
jgi:hypothetical protein